MTHYEWIRWLLFPIMTVHLQTVRKDLLKLTKNLKSELNRDISILDVGGRKSPYTIGIPAHVTLLDVPQEPGTKAELNLGFTDRIVDTVKQKRSNISNVVIQDMTKSQLRDGSYDAVVCVEVIEHVEQDEAFVAHISKVIADAGWAYFTTPNGDFIKNEGPDKNKDHIRHYTKHQLEHLLRRYFRKVEVRYAVRTGTYRVNGLRGFDKKRPWVILKTVLSNLVNKVQSKNVQDRMNGTAHLIAVCYK